MNAGGARFDHGPHRLGGVEGADESGFGVGGGRSEPVNVVAAFGMVDLIGAHQGLIDAAHHVGHAVGWIETLVGVHLAGVVGVGGDLPAAYIDGFQSGLYLLDGLVESHLCKRLARSEEHTSELQSHLNLVCRLLLEKKKANRSTPK